MTQNDPTNSSGRIAYGKTDEKHCLQVNQSKRSGQINAAAHLLKPADVHCSASDTSHRRRGGFKKALLHERVIRSACSMGLIAGCLPCPPRAAEKLRGDALAPGGSCDRTHMIIEPGLPPREMIAFGLPAAGSPGRSPWGPRHKAWPCTGDEPSCKNPGPHTAQQKISFGRCAAPQQTG